MIARSRHWCTIVPVLLSPSLGFVLTFVLTSFTAAPTLVPPAPPTGLVFPYEDEGACPSEGCTYGRRFAARPLTVRRSRDAGAAPAFHVGAGETVDAVTGVVVTLRPGRARVVAPIDVDGVRLAKGEHLLILRAAGEGGFRLWAHGRPVDVRRDVAAGSLAVLSEPRTVWWVQVRNRHGETGWTSDPDGLR